MKRILKQLLSVLIVLIIVFSLFVPAFAVSGKWIKSGTKWWYKRTDGSYTKNGWEKINNKWYHFDKDGWMQSGWLKLNGKWYYLGGANDGVMKSGWIKLNNKWYYLGGANDGVMKSGWVKYNNNWYYLGGTDDGVMKTGWIKDNNNWYYLESDGKMAADKWIGEDYVDSNGKWLKGCKQMNFSNCEITEICLKRYPANMRDKLGSYAASIVLNMKYRVLEEPYINRIMAVVNSASLWSRPLTAKEETLIDSDIPYALVIKANGTEKIVSFFASVNLAVYNDDGNPNNNVYYELDSNAILDIFEEANSNKFIGRIGLVEMQLLSTGYYEYTDGEYVAEKGKSTEQLISEFDDFIASCPVAQTQTIDESFRNNKFEVDYFIGTLATTGYAETMQFDIYFTSASLSEGWGLMEDDGVVYTVDLNTLIGLRDRMEFVGLLG